MTLGDNIEKLRNPLREAFAYGIWHRPIRSDSMKHIGPYFINHNEICRIPYENASRMGQLNLCIFCDWR